MIVKIYRGNVRVSLALLDQSTQMRCMKLVDVCRLYRTVSGDLVKLNIKRSLDATVFEGLDTLLNLNLL